MRKLAATLVVGIGACGVAYAAPAGMTTVTVLEFPSPQDTPHTVKLPSGTHAVSFDVKNGQLHCASIRLRKTDGGQPGLVSDRILANKAHVMMSSSAAPFESATANCHAVDANAQLEVSASAKP
jgi:hypothetical protein